MSMERDRVIIRTSGVGIGVNVLLVLFKMAVGLISGSIAVILDAVNNLSDALSSAITIVGTKLSGKAPDKKHPYGYGRIEYLTAVLVASLVLLAGATSLRESIEKLIHPTTATYSVWSLVIIAVAVVVKFLCGRYVKRVGERIHAQALVASGQDAFFDSILSLGTLLAAAASLLWGLRLEGIVGVIISLIIIKAGIEMLLETLGSIIGERADAELTENLRKRIQEFPGIYGVYDLTLHNYGPTQIIGSVHVEVDDNVTAREIHLLTRQIAMQVAMEYGVILTIGIYARNTSIPELAEIRRSVEELTAAAPEILQMHGFYGIPEEKCVVFDLIVDFKADRNAVRSALSEELQRRFPDYRFDIVLDSDYSD